MPEALQTQILPTPSEAKQAEETSRLLSSGFARRLRSDSESSGRLKTKRLYSPLPPSRCWSESSMKWVAETRSR